MSPGTRIEYKTLRRINPEIARKAVLEYLKTNGGNKADAARVFGINRTVVLKKAAEGDLRDRPKTPKHQQNKTPLAVEQKVIALRNKTHLGPQRLSIYLAKYQETQVPPGTIRHILRRIKDQLTKPSPRRRKRKKREFILRCIRAWEDGSAFPWVILHKSDDRLIGMVEIRLEGYKADLGYIVARPEWGNGYATEAVQSIVSWAIEQPSIFRVWALCDVDNIASARVLEKVGMDQEGVLRQFIIHPNVSKEPRDVYCYSLVKK
jgi:RimJ/RimL family protein N-acetyltransferase